MIGVAVACGAWAVVGGGFGYVIGRVGRKRRDPSRQTRETP